MWAKGVLYNATVDRNTTDREWFSEGFPADRHFRTRDIFVVGHRVPRRPISAGLAMERSIKHLVKSVSTGRAALTAVLLFHAPMATAQPTGPSTHSVSRLAPAMFPKLPASVRHGLEIRRCRVPQPWGARAPTNVIHGSFTTPRATEWAILCSVSDTSQILIYRTALHRTARLVDSLLPASDLGWMQGIGDSAWGYSRLLQTLAFRKIRAWRRDVDGRAFPQPIDHDAIQQVFMGKAAEAFYYVAGELHRRVRGD